MSSLEEFWKDTYAWLLEAEQHEQNGSRDLALVKVYRVISNLFSTGTFAQVNNFLAAAQTDDLSDAILLALLTSTLRYHAQLPARPEFFTRVGATLDKRGTNEKGLLDGLG